MMVRGSERVKLHIFICTGFLRFPSLPKLFMAKNMKNQHKIHFSQISVKFFVIYLPKYVSNDLDNPIKLPKNEV